MTETPRLSDQLRDIAIHAPIGFGEANRSVLFRAADELDSRQALESKVPIPVRRIVKESGIS